MSSLKRADRAFEYFLLITSILSSILFGLFTWILIPGDQNSVIAFAAILLIPNVVALVTWIHVTLGNISRRTITLRLIAWASADAGLSFSLILFMMFFSVKIIEINTSLGSWFYIVGSMFIISFFSISLKESYLLIGKLQNIIKCGTQDLEKKCYLMRILHLC